MEGVKKRVVTIGGGHGSHTLLTGLKKYWIDIDAVVSTFDSGGSGGRLGQELGTLPWGDVRLAFTALASDKEPHAKLARAMNYRFNGGSSLDGHAMGNLMLNAIQLEKGNAQEALQEAEAWLGLGEGRHVLPVSLEKATLVAVMEEGGVIYGEKEIGASDGSVGGVYLDPIPRPYAPVLEAIRKADAVILGPGDLYTSVIPNLLVGGVAKAICDSNAKTVYVCNVATKKSETSGFKGSDFIARLAPYMMGVPDYAIFNSRRGDNGHVDVDEAAVRALGTEPVLADVLGEGDRHHPHRLGQVVRVLI
ncbi:MAG: YvcK family protein [Candidatus Aenigmatarchaeota archaeon]|nr:MAG: YvcK family protein [Candidatus Aenigmarchaeota archaeon]